MTIGDLCRRTGLSPDLVRAWERRYGALAPLRAQNNHRLYREADLQRLLLLKRAVEAGRSIKQIAGLSDEKIRELLAAPPDDGEIVARLVMIVQREDSAALERELESALQHRSVATFCDRILAPLLAEVGTYWLQDAALIAKEHLASAAVANVLARIAQGAGGPTIVCATIPNERHVLGAWMAAAVAAENGFRPLILAAGAGPAEIAGVAKALRACGIALSVVYQEAEHTMRDLVARVRGLPLWAGGAKCPGGPWQRLDSMQQFAGVLNEL